MLRKFSVGLVVLALAAAPARSVAAQGFGEGYLDVGPTLGLGGIGDASFAFGGRLEKALKPISSLGSGMLGIQIGFQYYSYDWGFDYSSTYIPIGATVNYHFKLSDSKIDPFVGLGLEYLYLSCDYPGSGLDLCPDGGIELVARAGIRYFVKEKLALYADAGAAGGSTLNVGIMFKLK